MGKPVMLQVFTVLSHYGQKSDKLLIIIIIDFFLYFLGRMLKVLGFGFCELVATIQVLLEILELDLAPQITA